MNYEFRHIAEHELPAWFDLTAHVFERTGREYFMNHWFHDPWRYWEGIRVAVQDSKIVSTVRAFDRQIYLGGAIVNMGGIGEVCTLEEHRNHGLSGKLLQDALAVMADRQVGLSVLFTGKHGHYERYGWQLVKALRYRYANVPTELPGSAPVTVRPVNYAFDVYDMADLHTQTDTLLAGPVVRNPAYWWNWVRRSLEKATVAVKDGAIVAYMNSQYSTGTLHVTEFAAIPGEKRALFALLHEALHVADGAASVVVIPAALQQILGNKMREMAGEPEKLEQNIMCRVVNTMALAEQMRLVWEARLHSTDWHGSILVDVGIDTFTLNANANGLAVRKTEPSDTKVTFTHGEFLNLLYGNGNAQTDGVCSNDAARKAVAALFPPLAHTFWRADGF